MLNFTLDTSKRVIIMPIHPKSLTLYHILSNAGFNMYGFWDNDEALNGMTYDRVSITLPKSIDSLDEDVTIIVYSQRHEVDIKKQLFNLGYVGIVPARNLNLSDIQNYYHYLIDEDIYNIILKSQSRAFYKSFYANSKVISLLTPLPQCADAIMNELEKYSKKDDARKILLISHDLSLSGAPIALQSAARAILDNGDIPIICSRTGGGLLLSLLKDNIPVIVDYKLIENELFKTLVSLFDIIIVNTFTAQSINTIKKLNRFSVPILWWIHEGPLLCSTVQNEIIPTDLDKNVHVCCVGEYSRAAFMRIMPNITAGILLYGIKDFYEDFQDPPNDRLVIMTIGGFSNIKGQDIFCNAIRNLDESLRTKCEFVFVGEQDESNPICKEVLALKDEFPNHVMLTGEVERNKIVEFLHKCDCMVCASREDTMPIFITEAMMFHKVCICSENTGFASIINDGVNGFIFRNNSSDELCRKLTYYVENHALLDNMRAKSRDTYESNFTFDKFSKTLLGELDFIMK